MFTKFARQRTIVSFLISVSLLGLLLISPSATLRTGAEAQMGEGAGERGNVLSSAPLPPSVPVQARTITYAYDAAGRLVSANYGGGAGIAYAYDAAGNLVGVSPGGGRRRYLPLIMR